VSPQFLRTFCHAEALLPYTLMNYLGSNRDFMTLSRTNSAMRPRPPCWEARVRLMFHAPHCLRGELPSFRGNDHFSFSLRRGYSRGDRKSLLALIMAEIG